MDSRSLPSQRPARGAREPAGDPYEVIAPYYDLGAQAYGEDLQLYRGYAERTSGPILELGCGTGRLTLALAGSGAHVVGLDRAASMLSLARAKLDRHPDLPVDLIRADMRQPPLRAGFGLVIVACDSFLHLGGTEEQLSCLRSVRLLLAPGGVLVLDLAAPSTAGWEDWSPGIRPLVLAWSEALGGGVQLNKYSTFSVDASSQTHDVTEIYERLDCDGNVRRWTVAYSLRFVFPAELELLLEASGLRLLQRFGGYDLGPFHAGSERQICVAAPARRRRRH